MDTEYSDVTAPYLHLPRRVIALTLLSPDVYLSTAWPNNIGYLNSFSECDWSNTTHTYTRACSPQI